MVLDVAVVRQPFFVVVYVIEYGGQLVVREAVVGQVFDDDALELLEFSGDVAVVFREGLHVVFVCLFASQQCLDVREERLFLIFHVPAYVVGVVVE